MKRSIERPFLIVVMMLSIFVASLHFVRLSLGWDLVLDEWSVPTLLSGFVIIVTIFIAYWAWIIMSYEEEDEEDKKKAKEKDDEPDFETVEE